jgi:hypothetical protein
MPIPSFIDQDCLQSAAFEARTHQVLRTHSTFVTRIHGSVIHNYVHVAGAIFSRSDRHVREWHFSDVLDRADDVGSSG